MLPLDVCIPRFIYRGIFLAESNRKQDADAFVCILFLSLQYSLLTQMHLSAYSTLEWPRFLLQKATIRLWFLPKPFEHSPRFFRAHNG